MFISRISDDKREQLTVKHLQETADYAKMLAAKFGIPQMAYLAALLHDIGKFSHAFIEYLRNSDKNNQGSIIHATQGAKYIYEASHGQNDLLLVAEIIASSITGHHGSLMDCISPDGKTPLFNRITATKEVLYYEEVIAAFYDNKVLSSDINQILFACKKELDMQILLGKSQNLNLEFIVHLLAKSLLSCLVDADRYNAYCFETGVEPEVSLPPLSWYQLSERLENYLLGSKYSAASPLDHLRQDISRQCLLSAKRPKGIYMLDVPTGGGKTLSGLRFAINHAKEHDLEHIIYIVPYLSILEQTAKSIKEALQLQKQEENEIILEHHSNITLPENKEQTKTIQLLTSRWNRPIIITTLVQFLESIYSEKSGELRKLHNMAKSVLIFDEVQAMPVKCIHLFNEAINFLHIFGGSSVLLCTATQPLLNKTERPIRLSQNPKLIQNTAEAFRKLKRTRIVDATIEGGYSINKLRDFVLNRLNDSGNRLIILNRKKDAADLFKAIHEYLCLQSNLLPVTLIHLSTSMCPSHRLTVIKAIKRKLNRKNSKPILCISTQLIEAGVDISFGCVVRALAGLDSIAQAAGRCNRNGEDAKGRDVYLINLAEENLSKLPEIQYGKEITERIMREMDQNSELYDGDLLSPAAMQRYYQEFFYKRKNEMDYRIKGGFSLYDLLSGNKAGFNAYQNSGHSHPIALRQAFQTAGEQFFVIDQNTTPVVVPYKLGERLIKQYTAASLEVKACLLSEFNKYSVALYSYEKDILEKEGALIVSQDGIIMLDKRYYDRKLGVIFYKENEFLCY